MRYAKSSFFLTTIITKSGKFQKVRSVSGGWCGRGGGQPVTILNALRARDMRGLLLQWCVPYRQNHFYSDAKIPSGNYYNVKEPASCQLLGLHCGAYWNRTSDLLPVKH